VRKRPVSDVYGEIQVSSKRTVCKQCQKHGRKTFLSPMRQNTRQKRRKLQLTLNYLNN